MSTSVARAEPMRLAGTASLPQALSPQSLVCASPSTFQAFAKELLSPNLAIDWQTHWRLRIDQELAAGPHTFEMDLRPDQAMAMLKIWQNYPMHGTASLTDAFIYNVYQGYKTLESNLSYLSEDCQRELQSLVYYLFFYLSNIQQLAARPDKADQSDFGMSSKSFHRSYKECIEQLKVVRQQLLQLPLTAHLRSTSGKACFLKKIEQSRLEKLQTIFHSLQRMMEPIQLVIELSSLDQSLSILAEVNFNAVFFHETQVSADLWLEDVHCFLFQLKSRQSHHLLAHADHTLESFLKSIHTQLAQLQKSNNYEISLKALNALFDLYNRRHKHAQIQQGIYLMLMNQLESGEINLLQVVETLHWNPVNHMLSDFHLTRLLHTLKRQIPLQHSQETDLRSLLKGTLLYRPSLVEEAFKIIDPLRALSLEDRAFIQSAIECEYKHLTNQVLLKLAAMQEEFGWLLNSHTQLVFRGLHLLNQGKETFQLRYDALIDISSLWPEEDHELEAEEKKSYILMKPIDLPDSLRICFQSSERVFEQLQLKKTTDKLRDQIVGILEESLEDEGGSTAINLYAIIRFQHLVNKLESKIANLDRIYKLLLSAIQKEIRISKKPLELVEKLLEIFTASYLGPYEELASLSEVAVALYKCEFYLFGDLKRPTPSRIQHERLVDFLEQERHRLQKRQKPQRTTDPQASPLSLLQPASPPSFLPLTQGVLSDSSIASKPVAASSNLSVIRVCENHQEEASSPDASYSSQARSLLDLTASEPIPIPGAATHAYSTSSTRSRAPKFTTHDSALKSKNSASGGSVRGGSVSGDFAHEKEREGFSHAASDEATSIAVRHLEGQTSDEACSSSHFSSSMPSSYLSESPASSYAASRTSRDSFNETRDEPCLGFQKMSVSRERTFSVDGLSNMSRSERAELLKRLRHPRRLRQWLHEQACHERRQRSSHHILDNAQGQALLVAFHPGKELGPRARQQIAKQAMKNEARPWVRNSES